MGQAGAFQSNIYLCYDENKILNIELNLYDKWEFGSKVFT